MDTLHVELLVIGNSPGGRALAERMSAAGCRVVLVEQVPRTDGSPRPDPPDPPGPPPGPPPAPPRVPPARRPLNIPADASEVTVIRGHARFVGEKRVEIRTDAGRLVVTARTIIVDSGADPALPHPSAPRPGASSRPPEEWNRTAEPAARTTVPGTPPHGTGPGAAAVRALFHDSSLSMAVWDRALRCVWFNDSVHDKEIYHRGPEPGGHVTDLVHVRHPEFLERAMAQVLDSGVPLLGYELWPVLADPAEVRSHYFRVSLVPLDGPDGRPLGVCSIATRVSAEHDGGRHKLLCEAESRIGTDLDPLVTSQELAETALPELADFITVDLVEAVPFGREPLQHLKPSGTGIPGFYRAGVASVHDALRAALPAPGTPVYIPPASPLTAVLNSGRSHFEPVLDRSPGRRLDSDPERARIIDRAGMHSLMIVPLRARGSVLGVAVLARSRNPAPFSRADLALAEGLATRVSLSLDNALRYARERTAALVMQRDLMPQRLSGGSTVEVASRYLPADTHGGVGGDWFDVIPLSECRVALVLGDVFGHGIDAAVTMGRLRAMVRALSKLDVPPDELLRLLDELVVDLARDRDDGTPVPTTVAATCLYAVYDATSRRCVMASAGHPPPAIIAPDGSVAFADVPPGAPVGVGLGSFTSVAVTLEEGTALALYSDGLVEGVDHDIDRGLHRLRTVLARPGHDALDDVCVSVVDALAPEGPVDDDITLLLARTRPCGG
ncbi:SpoIIE family protein phosphatase [Streptomyces sp. NPDC089424]|uniref:SpoIIE family protein phosphatase n=1 Tax=Streptomyces sp. NPDC089424 TaxID=3365917 RepID=UPI00382CD81D